MEKQHRTHDGTELKQIYEARFAGLTIYRRRVWAILARYFEQFLPKDGSVLDVGAGYCEFINNVQAGSKYAIDLNPEVTLRADKTVRVLEQDCTATWAIDSATIDAVFTSNFLEHLADKQSVVLVLEQSFRVLRPGGRFIAMGPNIKYCLGGYWDFFDHYVPLTEASLAEALSGVGFEVEVAIGRFLPYTMSRGREYSPWILRLYLVVPVLWRLFGKQFLVVARRPPK